MNRIAVVLVLSFLVISTGAGAVYGASQNYLGVSIHPKDNIYRSYTGEKTTFIINIEDSRAHSSAIYQYRYYIRVDFGDNQNAIMNSDKTKLYVNHTYRSSGRYSVKVYVKDVKTGLSVWKKMDKEMVITSRNKKPVAVIEIKDDIVKTGEKLKFDASQSYDPDGSIVNYTWNFGDGTTGYGEIVYHSFSDPGTYTVTLTVRDDKGCNSYSHLEINVEERNYQITIHVNRNRVDIGERVTVHATLEEVLLTSVDNEKSNNMISYEFIWGDGSRDVFLSSSTSINRNHTYLSEGTYSIQVKVRFHNKIMNSNIERVIVKNMEKKDFSVTFQSDRKSIEVGEDVTFKAEIVEFNTTVSSLSSIKYRYSYRVDFGDRSGIEGFTDDRIIVTDHTYSHPGLYSPKIYITREDGLSKWAGCGHIIVKDKNTPPVARFVCPSEGKTGDTIIFDASQSYDPDGKIVKYIWNFGDGKTTKTILPEVKHSYSKSGTYIVNLTVVDVRGAENSTSKKIVIEKTETGNRIDIILNANKDSANIGEEIVFTAKLKPHRDNGNNGKSRTYSWKQPTYHHRMLGNLIDIILRFFRGSRMASILSSEVSRYRGKSLYSYTFDFGDGTRVTRFTEKDHVSVQHAYSKEGEYRIFVKVKRGDYHSISNTITVEIKNESEKLPTLYGDTPDQSQERHDGYYKIRSIKICQSFVPRFSVLTRIELYLGKTWRFDDSNKATSLASIGVGKHTTDLYPKSKVYVIISDKPTGDAISNYSLITTSVPVSEIPAGGGWVSFDVEYHNSYYGITRNIDHAILVPGKTYYIALYSINGYPLLQDVVWYYGNNNPYKDGKAVGEGINSSVDFAFRTYGHEDDGVVNRYALLIGAEVVNGYRPAEGAAKSMTTLYSILKNDPNWRNARITMLLNKSVTMEAIRNVLYNYLDRMDGDDEMLIAMAGHGDRIGLMVVDGNFGPDEMKTILDVWNVKLTLIVGTCFSGWWAEIDRGDRRVIVTSSAKDQYTSTGDWGGGYPFFTYVSEALSDRIIRVNGAYLDLDHDGNVDRSYNRGDRIPSWEVCYPDRNGDGYVSGEEVWWYVHLWDTDLMPAYETPQLSDGYPFLNNNSTDLDITYIGNN